MYLLSSFFASGRSSISTCFNKQLFNPEIAFLYRNAKILHIRSFFQWHILKGTNIIISTPDSAIKCLPEHQSTWFSITFQRMTPLYHCSAATTKSSFPPLVTTINFQNIAIYLQLLFIYYSNLFLTQTCFYCLIYFSIPENY